MSDLVQAPTAVTSELSDPSESPGPITATSRNEARYIGLTTRAIAFLVDAALICLVGFLVGEAAHLIALSFHITNNVRTILKLIGGGAFVLWAVVYHISFWSATGQTPGDRVMHIRVVTASFDLVKPSRGIVRCIGTVLAVLPLFLGFAPVLFDKRHRSFADWLARTVVIDAPGLSIAQSIAGRRLDAHRQARAFRA